MTRERRKNKRLVALFLLGSVLFNYPLLSLCDLHVLVFGIPLLYVYVFGIWGFLIGLSAFVTRIR
ncbi:MAG: hypothetical protein JSW39_14310 [Desulfobacterales bacterium]|nr:MAG: hypothetical protein JSW39_14310 [Desulfobacterales bacterium]